ncbi:PAS domain S-box protein [bacterium]|nr:PAS domain S-box protein [bacterium]
MKDADKTKTELIRELNSLRKELNILKQFKTSGVETEKRNAILNLMEDLQLEIEERKLSEEKYRLLFHHANDIILLHLNTKSKKPDRFIEVNDTAVRMLGYSKKEMLEKTPMDILLGDDRQDVRRMTHRLFQKGEALFERILISKSGREIPVEIHSKMFHYQGRKATLSVCRDISERKHAEQELIESERRFHELTELLPQTVYEMDLNGNMIYVNRHGFKMFGYTRADINRGANISSILLPEDLKRGFEKMSKILNGRDKTGNEYRARRKNGSEMDVIVFQAPIYRDGRHAGWRGTVIDITERKKTEDYFRQFKSAVDSSLNAIGMATPDGRHWYQNRAFDQLFGKAGEDPPSTVFVDEAVGRDVFSTVMKGDEWVGEAKMIGRTGAPLDILLHGYAVKDERNTIIALVGLHVDITQRKRMEKALQVSESNLHKAFEIASIGQWKYDIKNDRFQWSRNAVEVIGFNKKQIPNTWTEYRELISPEDRSQVFNPAEASSKTGAFNLEYRLMIRRRLKWVKMVFHIEFDANNRADTATGIIQDITERKAAVENIRKLARFPSENPYPVLRFLNDGTLLYANESAKPLLKRWKIEGNRRLPKTWRPLIASVAASNLRQNLEVTSGDYVYMLSLTPIREAGYVNVYGMDVTARKEAEIIIQNHHEQLKQLSSRLIQAQEEERKNLSRELHDEMGQALTGIKLNLSVLQEKANHLEPRFLLKMLSETENAVVDLMQDMHRLALELRPSILDDLGLVPALRWYVKRFAEHRQLMITFKATNMDERLAAKTEIILYRIIQESLTNIAKYAKATQVTVHLHNSSEAIYLKICDNGRGFDTGEVFSRAPDKRGIGLVGIQERVAAVDGIVTFKSRSGKGTTVKAVLPLNA